MSELRPSKEELAAKATEEEDMQAVKLPRRSAQPLAVTSHARAKCQGLRSQYHNRVVWTFELTHYATIQQDSAFSRKEKKEEWKKKREGRDLDDFEESERSTPILMRCGFQNHKTVNVSNPNRE